MTFAERAAELRERVEQAAVLAGRDPASITIIAVSKTFPRELIDEAYDHGFRDFGESRVQEIRDKLATPLPVDSTLHMIGQLQTNKVRQMLRYADVLQTVDRPNLVKSLSRELPKQERELEVLIEVNIAGEEQKGGCSPEDASTLLASLKDVPLVQPCGLMTMAPYDAPAEAARHVFRGLRELRDRLQQETGLELPVLSMGMSDDFEHAISEGATHIRVGRMLFGER